MQSDALNCIEARVRIGRYLAGEPCPEVAAHLAGCEACLDAYLDAALRQPQEVHVPGHFRSRLLARLPVDRRADEPEYSCALLSTAGMLVALGAGLWWSGDISGIAALLTDALMRPTILIGVGGIEAALSLLWLWRVATADR
jgi:hypothetical protein